MKKVNDVQDFILHSGSFINSICSAEDSLNLLKPFKADLLMIKNSKLRNCRMFEIFQAQSDYFKNGSEKLVPDIFAIELKTLLTENEEPVPDEDIFTP